MKGFVKMGNLDHLRLRSSSEAFEIPGAAVRARQLD
jgi:hypothetical protein